MNARSQELPYPEVSTRFRNQLSKFTTVAKATSTP